jgi:predicted alpha/beta superfamily hydrolase
MAWRPRSACGLLAGWCAALVAVAAQAATTLEVQIDLRAEIAAGRFDPRQDRVGLRGSRAPLAWDRTLLADDADGDGRYELVLRLEAPGPGGAPLQYKFKLERPGFEAEGWEAGINHRLLLQDGVQRLARAFGSAPPEPPLQRTGHIERHPGFASTHVAAREVQVWLPPGYTSEPQRRYPVLYLHDGQAMFDAGSGGAEWHVDETADRLVRAGAVAPLLVVAVSTADAVVDPGADPAQASRVFDYTPVPGLYRGQRLGGGTPAYARFLVDELKPFIDRRYRTLPGPAHTWTGGSSLGGLASMWLLLQHPDVFGAGLVVSPSVWWSDAAILRDVAAFDPARPWPRVWLDIGTREGDEALTGARQLRAALVARGWGPDRLQYLEAPGAGHDTDAWAARVEPMLRFLAPSAGR